MTKVIKAFGMTIAQQLNPKVNVGICLKNGSFTLVDKP